MLSYIARIERTNRKSLADVEVRMTIQDLSTGRQRWTGEFMARSVDGFLPDERISLTLANGQQGTARVSETAFYSRRPEATLVQFTGTSPLA